MNPITRRQALQILSAGAVAASANAEAPFRFTTLDHIEISEPDSAKSAALYARIFGGPIWKNNKTQRRYVKLGPAYIAVEQGREPFGVDHFSAGIEATRSPASTRISTNAASRTGTTPAART